MDTLLILSAVLYTVSAVAYALNFQKSSASRGSIGTSSLLAGWVAQTFFLGLLTALTGSVPLTKQVLPAICAWLLVVVYLYLGEVGVHSEVHREVWGETPLHIEPNVETPCLSVLGCLLYTSPSPRD